MSIFSTTDLTQSKQIAECGQGFAAAAIQYIAATKREPSSKLTAWSNAAAGLGTGAAVFFVSLCLLQMLAS